MLDFFIALLGGLYYGGKYANEKAKDRKYYLSERKRDELYDHLHEMLTAPGIEGAKFRRDATERVYSGDYYDEICEEFADDFQFIFGDQWKSVLAIPPYGHLDKKCNYKEMVLGLIYASKGWFRFVGGLDAGNWETREIYTRYMQRIEEYLRKNGKDVTFVLKVDEEEKKRGIPSSWSRFQFEELAIGDCKRLW